MYILLFIVALTKTILNVLSYVETWNLVYFLSVYTTDVVWWKEYAERERERERNTLWATAMEKLYGLLISHYMCSCNNWYYSLNYFPFPWKCMLRVRIQQFLSIIINGWLFSLNFFILVVMLLTCITAGEFNHCCFYFIKWDKVNTDN